MLTDEELIAALQGAFDDATADVCPPSELVRTTCRRQRNRHRRVRIAQAALPVALVLAVSGTAIAWHGPHRQSASVTPSTSVTTSAQPSTGPTSNKGPTSSSPSSTSTDDSALNGYRLKLPITFVPGAGPPGCPSTANLSSAEKARLFTAPGSRCPFLVQSVISQLPGGMLVVTATAQPSGEQVKFYRGMSPDGKFYNSYVRVRLSTGGSVYVLIDPLQGSLSLQQYAELADGTIATRA
jgi:hypothetical protein